MLAAARPTWHEFPAVLSLAGPPARMRVRLLNFTRWFALADGKGYALTIDDRLGRNDSVGLPLRRAHFKPAGLSGRARARTCLVHAVGKKANATWRARKLWFL